MFGFFSSPAHVCWFDQWQVAPNLKPSRSAESIELECLYAMRRNAIQSSSLYSNSSYNLDVRQSPKCVMVGAGRNFGYNRRQMIFRNIEVLQAKESAAKEKNALSKAR